MNKPKTLEVLLKKFPANEYALMEEVRDSAGFSASRSADFLIMSLWPSRGLNMIGIERKSFRGDWLKELKTPEKAENIYQYCDYWYLLTDNDSVAKIEEIPDTWGWMHIDSNGKLRTYKEPKKLTPIQISRSFLACILKRAACKDGWIMAHTINDKITEAREAGKVERNRMAERLSEDYKALQKTVSEFEATTGVKLTNQRWGDTGTKIGEAVNFVLKGGVEDMKSKITNIKNINQVIANKINEFEQLTDK